MQPVVYTQISCSGNPYENTVRKSEKLGFGAVNHSFRLYEVRT